MKFIIGDIANGKRTSEDTLEAGNYIKALEELIDRSNLYIEGGDYDAHSNINWLSHVSGDDGTRPKQKQRPIQDEEIEVAVMVENKKIARKFLDMLDELGEDLDFELLSMFSDIQYQFKKRVIKDEN